MCFMYLGWLIFESYFDDIWCVSCIWGGWYLVHIWLIFGSYLVCFLYLGWLIFESYLDDIWCVSCIWGDWYLNHILMIFGMFPVFGVAGHKRSIIVVEVPLAAAMDDVVTRNVISLFVMFEDIYISFYLPHIFVMFNDLYISFSALLVWFFGFLGDFFGFLCEYFCISRRIIHC